MREDKDSDASPASSLRADGRRNFVHPADVHGKFTTARKFIFAGLLALYVALPWIDIGGHPAIFLDIAARRFHVFGSSFNAQDTWMLFFLLSGIGFALFVLTALFGRVWCGYACPQTVFLEGLFRGIERWIEGPRNARLRLQGAPWTLAKIARKVLKHLLFVLLSAAVAHVFLSYFVSLPRLFEMMRDNPAEHSTAFLWVLALTAAMYFNFAWFREQMCLILCPYGRLQSVMTDIDTLVIGYDETRGEPRAKRNPPGSGDCVDCKRCVVVCPTGIDIRNGLQIDCIGCAACIDACDEVMVKLKKPTGLIRYDSQRGLSGQLRRFWRPRLALYGTLAVVGLLVATIGFRSHSSFEANLMRLGGSPFVLEKDGRIQNLFELHIVNKESRLVGFSIEPSSASTFEYTIAMANLELKADQGMRVPIFVYSLPSNATAQVELVIRQESTGLEKTVQAAFLRPR